MMVELRPVTRDNLLAVTRLKVDAGQEHFVAPNVYSVAQSKVYPDWEPMGVYDGDDLVGFIMWGLDPDEAEPQWWIIRLMVDAQYQKKGYGRAAMQDALACLREKGARDVLVSFEPNNDVARSLYRSLGFADTGQVLHGEIVYRLEFAL
jgi:diamine N-acetyltransferase